MIEFFLISSALLVAGCFSPDHDLDLNPLYRSMPHSYDGSTDKDTVIPFYFSRRTPEYSEWGLRPLIAFNHNVEKDETIGFFLPPFGYSRKNERKTMVRLWPIYRYTKVHHTGGGEDVDWLVFPLLFGGHSDDGENYFAFFPLGGRIRNFLTFNTFDFVLWPLYQRVTMQGEDEAASSSILFLIAWTDGGNRDHSSRVLPFYSYRRWDGKYVKYSVLWPFFHYQKLNLDTCYPATHYSLWPLFVYETSAIHHRFGLIGPIAFLGPLIQISRQTPDEFDGEPNMENENYYVYDVPWPLVRVERNKTFKRVRVFPFYSQYTAKDFESHAFLIPFFWYRKDMQDRYEKKDFHFVPFFHTSSKIYSDGSGSDSYTQVWPLFHHWSKATGAKEFATLSIFPLRLFVSLDKLLWPFFNIYKYHREPSGTTRHDAVFGLITAYDDPEETRFSFPLLYSYSNHQSRGWDHSFLLGLFSFGGGEEGLKKLRLLYIPLLDSE